jgi:C4-dicarboxylate-specific signal transduction histidine kinase
MDALKEKLLNDTYTKFIDVVFKSFDTDGILNDIVDNDIIGIGTTVDEKIFSLADFRKMLRAQKEQSEGLQIQFKITPTKHLITPTGNTAVFADDTIISIKVDTETVEMYVRISTVLEYRKDKWMIIHFHGSKPEYVESEKDTFGIEDWKQKNAELEKKVAEKTAELQKSLQDLKSTQSQLIQSEKMASLGELTAGIAHEIQNPLNFVNNFSDVNRELLEELKQEADKGNLEDVKAITEDVMSNSEKINHHGKRADAIVKGMLQHSQSSTGKKEPTDINALCDEYLRLSYHGLRAKDKSFNASMKTDFDSSIGNINIIPQDIGRVILNLLTNAFYAVNERKKESGEDYEPTVTVSTRSIQPPSGGQSVVIKVTDNGDGIPQKVLDKIFQPFFTTKSTGQGTGLGLSLSYDIIKAHGGEIKVETLSAEAAAQAGKESNGTAFTILLPVT